VSSRAYAVHDQNVPPQETNRNYGPFTPVQRTHVGLFGAPRPHGG
jgi:hypothetical protein